MTPSDPVPIGHSHGQTSAIHEKFVERKKLVMMVANFHSNWFFLMLTMFFAGSLVNFAGPRTVCCRFDYFPFFLSSNNRRCFLKRRRKVWSSCISGEFFENNLETFWIQIEVISLLESFWLNDGRSLESNGGQFAFGNASACEEFARESGWSRWRFASESECEL